MQWKHMFMGQNFDTNPTKHLITNINAKILVTIAYLIFLYTLGLNDALCHHKLWSTLVQLMAYCITTPSDLLVTNQPENISWNKIHHRIILPKNATISMTEYVKRTLTFQWQGRRKPMALKDRYTARTSLCWLKYQFCDNRMSFCPNTSSTNTSMYNVMGRASSHKNIPTVKKNQNRR